MMGISISNGAKEWGQFSAKWGCRALAAGFTGYYSLGYAYRIGLMAAIDRIAISLIVKRVGYAGLGAAMPWVQRCAAHAVYLIGASAGACMYEKLKNIFLRSTRLCTFFGQIFGGSLPSAKSISRKG